MIGTMSIRRKTTKEIIAESFHELAAKSSIDRITIREITDNCGYSPATFYRHFKDKYDLIAWDYTRDVAGIMDRIDDNEYVWKHSLVDGACYYLQHRDYLKNLLLHTEGHDAFIRYMTEINLEALKKHIRKASGKTQLDEETEMLCRVYASGTINLTCEWILGKYVMEPEEIGKVYEDSLPEPLREYLL